MLLKITGRRKMKNKISIEIFIFHSRCFFKLVSAIINGNSRRFYRCDWKFDKKSRLSNAFYTTHSGLRDYEALCDEVSINYVTPDGEGEHLFFLRNSYESKMDEGAGRGQKPCKIVLRNLWKSLFHYETEKHCQ